MNPGLNLCYTLNEKTINLATLCDTIDNMQCTQIPTLPAPTAIKPVSVLFVFKSALSLLVIRRFLLVVRRLKSRFSTSCRSDISLVVILLMLERGGRGSMGCESISAFKSPQLIMRKNWIKSTSV